MCLINKSVFDLKFFDSLLLINFGKDLMIGTCIILVSLLTTSFTLNCMQTDKAEQNSRVPALTQLCLSFCKKDLTIFLPQLVKVPHDLFVKVLSSLTISELVLNQTMLVTLANDKETVLANACEIASLFNPELIQKRFPTLLMRVAQEVEQNHTLAQSVIKLIARAFSPTDIIDVPFHHLIPFGLYNKHKQSKEIFSAFFERHIRDIKNSRVTFYSSAKPLTDVNDLAVNICSAVADPIKQKRTSPAGSLTTYCNTGTYTIFDSEEKKLCTLPILGLEQFDEERNFPATISPDKTLVAIATPYPGVLIYKNGQAIFTFAQLCQYDIIALAFNNSATKLIATLADETQLEFMLPINYLEQKLTLEQIVCLMVMHHYSKGLIVDRSSRLENGRGAIVVQRVQEAAVLESFNKVEQSFLAKQMKYIQVTANKIRTNVVKAKELTLKSLPAFIETCNSYFTTKQTEALPQVLSRVNSTRVHKKISKQMLKILQEASPEVPAFPLPSIKDNNFEQLLKERTQRIAALFFGLETKIGRESLQYKLKELLTSSFESYEAYK